MHVISPRELKRFARFIQERSGIKFDEGKKDLWLSSLSTRMKKSGCETFDQYWHAVNDSNTGNKEFRELIKPLTIGETFFFRSEEQFEDLRKFVIPEIIERKRDGSRRLLVLSAGCATGEEVYTIAILLKEVVGHQKDWNLKVFGTDINEEMLDIARKGRYSQRSVKSVPEKYLRKYFNCENDEYIVRDSLKEITDFRFMNLVDEPLALNLIGAQKFDFVMCRNVTIYFGKSTQQKVFNNLYNIIDEGGYLITGTSESLIFIDTPFIMKKFRQSIFYKKCAKSRPSWEESDFEDDARICQSAAKENNSGRHRGKFLEQAEEFARKGDYEEALREISSRIRAGIDISGSYFVQGLILMKKGDWERAIKSFEKTLNLDGENLLARFYLARGFEEREEFTEARENYRVLYRSLLKREPGEMISEEGGYTVNTLLELCRERLGFRGNNGDRSLL